MNVSENYIIVSFAISAKRYPHRIFIVQQKLISSKFRPTLNIAAIVLDKNNAYLVILQ